MRLMSVSPRESMPTVVGSILVRTIRFPYDVGRLLRNNCELAELGARRFRRIIVATNPQEKHLQLIPSICFSIFTLSLSLSLSLSAYNGAVAFALVSIQCLARRPLTIFVI